MYSIEVELEHPLEESVFRSLEREVRFKRGGLEVKKGAVVATAADPTALRSLAGTIFRALYVARALRELCL